VTGSLDWTAKVWDATSGAEILTLKGHAAAVMSASFSADGSRIVTGSGDNTARVWDAKSGTEFLTLSGHTDGVRFASFSMSGSRIVTASLDGTAKVWDSLPFRDTRPPDPSPAPARPPGNGARP
jgi:WD40 repeat protein